MIVDREPFEPSVIPLPLGTVAFELIPRGEPSFLSAFAQVRVERGPEGEYRFRNADDLGIRYRVSVAPEARQAGPALPREDVARYLALPPLPERVAKLAATWAAEGSSDLEKARAIERHLRSEYRYDLASPSGGAPQPLDHFLFESRRGHCEFYSTAMAVMLRTAQIPSRNVTGFVGGTWNRFSQTYTVRQGDAHAWVEAFIETEPGRGAWMTFDPTPTAAAQPLEDNTGLWPYVRDLFEALSQRWTRYVVGYDLRTQTHLLQGARDGYENFRARQGMTEGIVGAVTRPRNLAALAAASAVVAYVLWRKRRTPQTKSEERKSKSDPDPSGQLATRLYNTLESALASHGLSRPSATPPLRYAEQLARKGHPFADEVADLTEIYLRTRFGRAPLAEADAASFAARVAQIKKTKLEPPPSSKSP